jgi:hypothetical protein
MRAAARPAAAQFLTAVIPVPANDKTSATQDGFPNGEVHFAQMDFANLVLHPAPKCPHFSLDR